MRRIVIKGTLEDAKRAAEVRGVNLLGTPVPHAGGYAEVWAQTDASWEKLARWFCSTAREPLGFPPGSLLYYGGSLTEAEARAERERFHSGAVPHDPLTPCPARVGCPDPERASGLASELSLARSELAETAERERASGLASELSLARSELAETAERERALRADLAATVKGAESQIGALRTALADTAEQLSEARMHAETLSSALEGSQAELEGARRAHREDAHRDAFKLAACELNRRRSDLAAELAAAQRRAQVAEAYLEDARAELSRARNMLAAERAELARGRATRGDSAEVETLRKHHAELTAENLRIGGELAQVRREWETAREWARAEVAERKRAQERHDSELEKLSDDLDTVREERDRRTRELATAQAQVRAEHGSPGLMGPAIDREIDLIAQRERAERAEQKLRDLAESIGLALEGID